MSKKNNWQERISIQRTKLLLDNPFFGFLAIQLEVVEDTNNTPTMSTDGTNLYVNAEFIQTLTDQELQFVLAHEVMHIALDHIPRLNQRNHSTWNKATDYVINQELATNKSLKMPKGGLINNSFRGMSAEDIYDTLMKQQQQQQQSSSTQGASQGAKRPETTGVAPDANGDKPNNNKPDKQDKDPGRSGSIQYPKGTPQQVEKQIADAKVKVSQAIAIAKAQNAGTIPQSIQRLIELAKPKQDWRPILRNYIDDACQQNYSWTKQSRHSIASTQEPRPYLPGTVNDGTSHIVVAIDTSGSINPQTLNAFISEVQAAADTSAIQRITVIYADAKVQSEDEFLLGDNIRCNPKGGGGTDFKATFEHIRRNHQTAPLIIYFTDMETSKFGQQPDAPTNVLWAVWGTEHAFNHYAPKAPFGEAIHIN